jgi:hypothetical protein
MINPRDMCVNILSYTIKEYAFWKEEFSVCSRTDWSPGFLPVLGSLLSGKKALGCRRVALPR